MAVPLSNTLEGGSDGTTITTGNSGGASGDAFTQATVAATHTLQYKNTPTLSQLLCAVITPGGTAGTTFVQWNAATVGTIGPTVYTRQYFRAIGAFGTINNRLLYMEGASGSTHRAGIEVGGTGGSPGKFSWVNAAGTIGTLSTNTLLVDTTYRFECRFTLDATVGQVDVRCYVGDATVPLETLSSAANVNFGATTMDTCSWGSVAQTVTNLTQAPYALDGLAIGTAGYFGPATSSGRFEYFSPIPFMPNPRF